MAGTSGKKEYTIIINGVEKSIQDITKLEKAVSVLDGTVTATAKSTTAAADSVAKSSKAVNDEEKAEKKLQETLGKITAARSDANKKQVEANIQLRETQREVQREVQARGLAGDSIKAMGMQLTDLRSKYDNLTRAEREDINVGGELLSQIQQLDDQYKGLKESTGRFQDSVGNYEKATSGIKKVGDNIEGVAKASLGLTQGLLVTTNLMTAFGDESEETRKKTQDLQKVMLVLSLAQQVNTNSLKNNIVVEKAAQLIDAVRTRQIAAKTAAETAGTAATGKATIAQKIFNVVASANPYVILALALVAVVGALIAFSMSAETAAERQRKLNDAQAQYIDYLQSTLDLNRSLQQSAFKDKQNEVDLLKAQYDRAKTAKEQQALIKGLRKEEDALFKSRKDAADAEKENIAGGAIRQLDNNIRKSQQLSMQIAALDDKVDEDAKNNLLKQKDITDKAIALAQGVIENSKDIDRQQKLIVENRKKEDIDLARKAAEEARTLRDNELAEVRKAEDGRIKLIEYSAEQQRQTLNKAAARQIEDLKNRIKDDIDNKLTVKARAAMRDQIVSIEKQLRVDLEKLERETAAKTLEIRRKLEDENAGLIQSSGDKQIAALNATYDRQIEDLKRTLKEDKTLNAEQQAFTSELILTAEKRRGKELKELRAKQQQELAQQQIDGIETQLNAVKAKIGDLTARDKGGLELINVKQTKKNLTEANAALQTYIIGIKIYLNALLAAHDATLSTLKEGTPEYEAELQAYTKATTDAQQKIKSATDEIKQNTTSNTRAFADMLGDLFGKIGEKAQAVSQTIGAVADAFNSVINMQLDELNKSLDIVDKHYDEAKSRREDFANQVAETEKQIQEAGGATSAALQQQLADQMAARNDAQREEQRLAKEKEKLEADIAKKEKQQKRVELAQGIVTAIANTAQGVTAALSLGVPGIILGAIIAIAGAVQVGIMSRQLAKLEKGGEIKGKRHSAGGVPIPDMGVEVEGGEFVVSRNSYAKNKSLVKAINSSNAPLSVADVAGIIGSGTSVSAVDFEAQATQSGNDKVVQAINAIDINPVVAVTDIIDVSDQVVSVRDAAGF